MSDVVAWKKPDALIEAGMAESFRDRIVELRRMRASDLRQSAKNWRLHPEEVGCQGDVE